MGFGGQEVKQIVAYAAKSRKAEVSTDRRNAVGTDASRRANGARLTLRVVRRGAPANTPLQLTQAAANKFAYAFAAERRAPLYG